MSLELPGNWVKCEIGDVAKVVGGSTPPSKDPTNFTTQGGTPWITPADLSGYKNIYISKGARSLSDKGFAACSTIKMPPGSVLFSSRAPVGYVAIASAEVTTNQGFKSFVLPDSIDSRFVYYYLRQIKPVAEMMATGTTFKELSGSAASKLPFVLAPLNEQKRIADKLDSLLAQVDACRERLDRVPLILKRFRQAVLAAATSGALTEEWRKANVFDKATEVDFPQVCRAEILTSIAEVIDPNPKHRNPKYVEKGFAFLSTAQFGKNDGWDFETKKMVSEETVIEQEARCRFSTKSIAFSRKGTIGKVRILPSEIRFALLDSLCVINPKENQNGRYLKICLESPFVQAQVNSLTRGVALKQISVGDVRSLKIPLPPPGEQFEIVRRIESLFAFADRLEARYASACSQVDQLTPSLLDKAFRGELVPQDPNDEPARILLERIRASHTDHEIKSKRGRKPSTRVAKRIPKGSIVMTKSRQDDDVKGRPYLAGHLQRLGGKAQAEVLFKESELPVADFYKQLAWEVAQGMIRDGSTVLEVGDAA